ATKTTPSLLPGYFCRLEAILAAPSGVAGKAYTAPVKDADTATRLTPAKMNSSSELHGLQPDLPHES
ncbi:MAG: hypothetical protein WAT77_15845, partial [Paracoccaceae bacterium]